MLTTSKFELPANDRRLTDSGDEVVKSSTIDEVDETKKFINWIPLHNSIKTQL